MKREKGLASLSPPEYQKIRREWYGCSFAFARCFGESIGIYSPKSAIALQTY